MSVRAVGGTLLSLLIGVAAVLAVPSLVPGAAAATAGLYVDRTQTGCSDSGPASAATPLCSLGKGVSLLHAGDTLYVGNGTYPETVTPTVSGTAGSPVTITSWPGRSPSIGAGAAQGIRISGLSWVTISNLAVEGTVGSGIYVTDGSHITLSGNTVTRSGSPAKGRTAAGILLAGTSSSTVTRNNSDRNSDSGIRLASGTTGAVVSYNEASLNAQGWQRNATGIEVRGSGNTVLGNRTHDNEDSGIQFYPGGNNNLAAVNLTYNNGDHGIDNLNVTGGRIIGNTVYHNCTSGINVEGTSGGFTVKNNVAVDNAVYPAYNGISCTRRAGNIGIWDSAPSSTVVDHNLVWLSKPGKMYVFGSSYTSLSSMRAATGQESHGVQADPRFAAASAGDLTLGAGSPAIDRADSGVSGAQSTDLLGAARVDDPGTPDAGAGPRRYDDLGAYEFQPSGTATPQAPTALLAVSPVSGSAPLQVNADASGSSDPQGQPLTYAFDFGDGSAVTSQSAATSSHTFDAAGTYVVRATVTNQAGLTDSMQRTVTVTDASPSPSPSLSPSPSASPSLSPSPSPSPSPSASLSPSVVSQIATNYSTRTHSDGYLTLWRPGGVAAGDLVVLSLYLGGTQASGPVTASDSAGSSYAVASSVADGAGNRLVVLSGVARSALAAGERITVTYPQATSYRLTGDEFAGVSTVDRVAGAAGQAGGFSSGATAQTGQAGELVFAAVASASGSGTPTWDSPWQGLSAHQAGSRSMGRGYQLPSGTGSYAATGTAPGPWVATTVTFGQ